jgi:hypothetical protein
MTVGVGAVGAAVLLGTRRARQEKGRAEFAQQQRGREPASLSHIAVVSKGVAEVVDQHVVPQWRALLRSEPLSIVVLERVGAAYLRYCETLNVPQQDGSHGLDVEVDSSGQVAIVLYAANVASQRQVDALSDVREGPVVLLAPALSGATVPLFLGLVESHEVLFVGWRSGELRDGVGGINEMVAGERLAKWSSP